jgi:hypothetical protein
MGATNQDQQRAAVRTALFFVQALSPSAQGHIIAPQFTNRHMRDAVALRNSDLRLA